jgi:ABC-type multidrug transport system ATPase subunit
MKIRKIREAKNREMIRHYSRRGSKIILLIRHQMRRLSMFRKKFLFFLKYKLFFLKDSRKKKKSLNLFQEYIMKRGSRRKFVGIRNKKIKFMHKPWFKSFPLLNQIEINYKTLSFVYLGYTHFKTTNNKIFFNLSLKKIFNRLTF